MRNEAESSLAVHIQPANRKSRSIISDLPRIEVRNPNLVFKEKLPTAKHRDKRQTFGKSINDVFRYLSLRWNIPKHRISLKLCRSKIELVQQDSSKDILTFSYPGYFKLSDLYSQNNYSPKHLMSYQSAEQP